jgi:hypothetical protein
VKHGRAVILALTWAGRGLVGHHIRCLVGVFRHGDRTPKQKMKMLITHDRFLEFMNKCVVSGLCSSIELVLSRVWRYRSCRMSRIRKDIS